MKTHKEYIDGAQELINQGHLMSNLSKDPAYQFLLKKLDEQIAGINEDVWSSQNWEEFLQKKYHRQGLLALKRETDTIISRGKAKERILKSK